MEVEAVAVADVELAGISMALGTVAAVEAVAVETRTA